MEINLELHDQYKDNYFKNEMFRLQKENIAIRMELNLIYEQMREDNKIFEMKDGSTTRRYSKDLSPEKKRKSFGQLQSANNSNSMASNNQPMVSPNPNPALFIKLKSENTEEIYVHYKNFINRLRMSDFII